MNRVFDLLLTPHPNKVGEFLLVRDYLVRWRGGSLLVPAETSTDFASIPKFFQNIIPKWGRYGVAAIAHDYLYRTKGLNGKYTKEECDLIFKKIMEYDKVKPWKITIMYNAVSAFGRFPD